MLGNGLDALAASFLADNSVSMGALFFQLPVLYNHLESLLNKLKAMAEPPPDDLTLVCTHPCWVMVVAMDGSVVVPRGIAP